MTIDLPSWGGKRVLVAGLGISGCAAVEALLTSGAKVSVWDDNQELMQEVSRHYAVQMLDIYVVAQWHQLDACLPAPGIKPNHLLFSRANLADCQIISDIDLLQQAVLHKGCRFIGITGTNGKSTTTALINHILNHAGRKAVAGGNIGDAALGLPMLGKDDYYVLELSSYQLHHMKNSRFHAAVLLNISPDHLAYHGTMQDYINSKFKIFAWQEKEDMAIVGISTEAGHAVAGALYDYNYQQLQLFSGLMRVSNGIFWEVDALWRVEEIISETGEELPGTAEKILNLRDYPHFSGRHNAENIAAAWAVCNAEGIADEKIISALADFTGLKHRQEYIGHIGNIHFVNDSKATNIEATQMALSLYPNIYWLAGGQIKDEPHRQLLEYIGNIKAGFFYGQGAEKFHKIFSSVCPSQKCETLEQALALAFQQAQIDCEALPDMLATILLAPAAASFDQFKSFEHRGDCFIEQVEKLHDALALASEKAQMKAKERAKERGDKNESA